ncbi:TRAP transporter small permease [Marinomonas spartinae]|uniref:TRAP transporter small permease n=1 Tax=Marinomonas spartinae TaxID=1792290 RepID=UPI0018F1C153|nr:TRAP transporter small permease [Marinomonas spartinae]MBJ7553952.1 TRAP transporter small permease [Marinomonas spartinae]
MFKKSLSVLSKILIALSCISLVLNILLLFFGVVSRYLFNDSPMWTDELSRYLIIGSVMLSIGTVYLSDGHMRVSLIKKYLPKKAHAILQWYRWIIVVGVSGLFSYISFKYALSLTNFQTMALGISKVYPYLLLPIGFLSLSLFSLLQGPYVEEFEKC